MPFLEDIGTYYSDQGQGPPVVLVHGFAFTHELWAEQQTLADEFRLIAYDVRGSGRSQAPATGYSYEDLGDELLALLDALSLKSAHLVGHSRGGAILLDVAFRRPERVRSLFFVDSVLRGFPWSEEWLAEIRRASKLCREKGVLAAMEEEWLHSSLFRWVRERRPEIFQRAAAMARQYSGAEWLDEATYPKPEVPDIERLQEVAHPTFVLSGQEDIHDFVEVSNMLAWWIPGARQRSLLGVSHFPMLENPYETNLYLRGFLRSLEAKSLPKTVS